MRKIIILLTFYLTILDYTNAQPFNITSTRDYNGEFATGTYQIYRSSSVYNITLSNLRKPLILVEGFDPNNSFGFDSNNTDPNTIDIYNFFNRYPTYLASQIHSEGYDIIILNFDNGGDYIQKNAMLLVELISKVNSQKPTTDPIVVVGYSMGGLVARYALTYMEENGLNHETRLYVSFDSPHKGAHVPVGIQALATTFDAEIYQTMFPDLANSLLQFTAPAAKQMLKYRINEPTEASGELSLNPDHQAFLSDMEGQNDCNGFPSTCRNVAISLGSWNGIGQRSNIDLDSDGIDDLQHSAFPILYINIPRSGNSGDPQAVWELNSCEAMAAFSFSIFLSTAYSSSYPYYSTRSSYGDLGEWSYATYWYRNNFGLIYFPQGDWSRLWWYQDEEPLDFAPGALMPLYNDILSSLNSQINCHFGYADNSTFIPTVSALAFDTEDLFYDIENDINRLDKTPFDNIIGITGDNTSHMFNPSLNSLSPIVSYLMTEIRNNYGFTCSKNYESLSGTINSGEDISISNVSDIVVSNYSIKNGASVNLTAGNSITLLPGFSAELGSEFSAKIQPCGPKPCSW